MAASRLSSGWMAGILAVIVLLLLPAVLGSSQLSLPIDVFLFALFAITYDLLFGFTGLISFGHALFIGTGAYALVIAMTGHSVSMWLAVVIVLLAGLAMSALTGILALRTRGVYFAMVTLAFAQAAYTLAQSDVGTLTGGENGMAVSGSPNWLTGPGNEAHFYYVALLALLVGFVLLRLFVLSPAGRVWQAIRENEQRVLMLGYRPYVFKLLVYVISGTIATLVGALYALSIGTVSPGLLSADTTVQLLLMVIIGGAGSLWGAILGAAFVRYLDHYLNVLSTSDFVNSAPSWVHQTLGQPLLVFGLVYLLLVYFFPQGIAGFVPRLPEMVSNIPLRRVARIAPAAGSRTSAPLAGLDEIEAQGNKEGQLEGTRPDVEPASPEAASRDAVGGYDTRPQG